MNAVDYIEKNANDCPNRTAVVYKGGRYNFDELNKKSNKIYNFIFQCGVKVGDRVALLLPNIPEFIVSYIGVLKLGAIATSVNVMLKEAEIAYILSDSDPSLLITTKALLDNLNKDKLKLPNNIILVENFKNIYQTMSDQATCRMMKHSDSAAILYTSGTTGFPMGAVLSHGNIQFNTCSVIRACEITSKDSLLLFLPLFHCFGQNFIMNSGLAAGATLYLEYRFNLENTIALVRREAITIFFAVPVIFIRCLRHNIDRHAFSSVRLFFTAAAPMLKEVKNQWSIKYGRHISEGYGLTETSPFASYNHVSSYKPDSIGRPIVGSYMKIIDAEGNDVGPNNRGEILIKGPNVMRGYWNNESKTKSILQNGWLYTGDIGKMDEEGYFYILGRTKDVIITSGFNVYPVEIENIILKHEDIKEVAVYGVPDQERGEVVKASVVLKEGFYVNHERLKHYCKEGMANYKVPKHIEFLTKLPRNSSGKVLKRTLRELSQCEGRGYGKH